MKTLFVDIGSNTIKALLTDFVDGRLVSFGEFSVPRRISAKNALAGDAVQIIEESIASLISSAKKIDASFGLYCFGTSALRDFADAPQVLSSLASKGINIRVLSGLEEAELSYKGALGDPKLALQPRENIVYADLGGGSMEFVYGTLSEISYSKSLPLGAVRLTNMFLENGRLNEEALSDFCGKAIGELAPPPKNFKLVISGGAITAVRFILGQGRISENFKVSNTDISYSMELVKKSNGDELWQKYSVPKNRSEVLPAAFICLLRTLKSFNRSDFLHTQHSLRYGVAAAYFAL